MKEDTKRWFCEKVAQNPEYLAQTFLPEIEKRLFQADVRLRQAIRSEKIEDIKYRMGWADGAQDIVSVLDGLRISEKNSQSEPGLMARIFSGFNP